MIPELLDEHVDVSVEDGREPDATDVRRWLIRVAQIEREEGRVGTLRAAVVAEYDARLAELERQREDLRAKTLDWVERFNGGKKVSIPDVGTAYLAKRAPRLVVEDDDLFENAVTELTGADERMYRRSFDKGAAREWAAKRLEETGEIVPGAAVEPARVSLVVKGLS